MNIRILDSFTTDAKTQLFNNKFDVAVMAHTFFEQQTMEDGFKFKSR